MKKKSKQKPKEEIKKVSASEVANMFLEEETNKTSLTKSQLNEIKNLVKVETFSHLATSITELSPIDREIMEDYSEGMTDREIKQKYQVSQDYLFNLYAVPSFITEVKKRVAGLTDKENLLRFNSRVGLRLLETFNRIDDETLAEMPIDKLLKAIKENMDTAQKLMGEDKVSIKVDITQMVTKSQIDTNRLNITPEGAIDIDVEYPSYDPEKEEVIGEWKDD